MRKLVLLFVITALGCLAQAPDIARLKELSKKPNSEEFEQALKSSLNAQKIQKGTAYLGEGPDFFFALEAAKPPELYVDDDKVTTLKRAGKSMIWYTQASLETGRSHSFYYMVGDAKVGGSTDVPCYGPESYEKPGVPHGKLSEKMVFKSHIYEGMESNYWIYTPAQYDSKTPAALFVWQDGQGLVQRDGATRSQIVFDNLTAEKKIPVIIQVYIQPGLVGTKAMRSIEYDTVNDTYARFLRDEILPEVYKNYNIRKDGYSRALGGGSSGGICAFNVAWQQPDQFSRVLSRIGSFTSIQWHPGELDGGNVYPFKIRKEPKRNIRVWLQDGSEDLENNHGSWPLENLQMANSLKLMGYDFHLSFGNGTHNGAHGNSELPEELIWLWRDYDPAKTDQKYTIEESESKLPLFRVRPYNR
jgi:enterochelin esterase family protein